MSDSDRDSDESFAGGGDEDVRVAFGEAVGQLGPVLLGGLDALEQIARRIRR